MSLVRHTNRRSKCTSLDDLMLMCCTRASLQTTAGLGENAGEVSRRFSARLQGKDVRMPSDWWQQQLQLPTAGSARPAAVKCNSQRWIFLHTNASAGIRPASLSPGILYQWASIEASTCYAAVPCMTLLDRFWSGTSLSAYLSA